MDRIQELAADAVAAVLGGANLDHMLTQALARNPLAPAEQGALRDACFQTLRQLSQWQACLDALLRQPLHDEWLRALLLVAIQQLASGRRQPYTVVDHAVRLAGRIQPRSKGLVNAVLRQWGRRQEEWPALMARPPACWNHPTWWVERLRAVYPEQWEAVVAAGNRHPPMALRVNRRMMSRADYGEQLLAAGLAATAVGEDGWLLATPVPVHVLPGFADGWVSVQDAGAQRAAGLLAPEAGMRVLDACAAPGGKAAHLAERADIDLWALDLDPRRVVRIEENFRRLRLSGAIRCADAGQLDSWWDGRPFERILLDVPCSGSGVVGRHPDIKWLRRPSDARQFAQQQAALLKALWPTLASGGTLLYATCSVFPEENAGVVDAFLNGHADARVSVPVDLQATHGALLPTDTHDGFYYALLHKA